MNDIKNFEEFFQIYQKYKNIFSEKKEKNKSIRDNLIEYFKVFFLAKA